ncbi:Septum site-determining protein MinD @ possible CpaE [Alloactinosynnema sp. L-07]|uniref:septum site-determining protein Ssd n=1 Tax=Alloactinosynnema sp. L-07 TaxID=1653480 RepID=UPI00065EF73D|nr:septum site-determining protein Ssd [Alloactinosynnema sp. L-07]CRK61074.1 Septum site-determining protein MinD @ possible CpaE [Alloactinosynnema sp. L-07]
MSRSVVCVEADALLDEVLRVAAAAGCTLDRVADAADLRTRWHDAPMVIIDADTAAACLAFALPRRESVVVVSGADPPPTMWPDALALGAQRVIALPDGEAWLVDAFADTTERPANQAGRTVAVIGGRGGAGASVFAAAMALTALDAGRDTLLVDCDPLGGGLDLLLGAEQSDGMRWPDLRLTSGRVPAAGLRAALPSRVKGDARLSLLSGAREGEGPSPDAVAAVLDAGKRGGDLVICDLPRAPAEAAQAALDRTDLAILVIPAELRGCAAAQQVAVRIAAQGLRAAAVVRTSPEMGLRPRQVAEVLGLPLLATVRTDPALSRSLDADGFRVRPRTSLAQAARAALRALPA